jgi:hypothetical protein
MVAVTGVGYIERAVLRCQLDHRHLREFELARGK